MFTHGLTSVIDGDVMLWEETDFANFQEDGDDDDDNGGDDDDDDDGDGVDDIDDKIGLLTM